jgi:NTE family protein
MRFSVGAVDICNGNFTYFDTTTHEIRLEHVVASGSLPPGFAATNVDGRFYWDGGLISNTPLQWVLEGRPRRDTLAFQIDLWSARGALPEDMIEVEVRHKEIVYSSRNRAATDQYQRAQRLRIALAHLISELPPDLRDGDDVKLLSEVANDKVCNIVHLIYRAKNTKASPRTLSSPGAPWRSTGALATTTRARPWLIQRCCSFPIGERACARSTSVKMKVESRPLPAREGDHSSRASCAVRMRLL